MKDELLILELMVLLAMVLKLTMMEDTLQEEEEATEQEVVVEMIMMEAIDHTEWVTVEEAAMSLVDAEATKCAAEVDMTLEEDMITVEEVISEIAEGLATTAIDLTEGATLEIDLHTETEVMIEEPTVVDTIDLKEEDITIDLKEEDITIEMTEVHTEIDLIEAVTETAVPSEIEALSAETEDPTEVIEDLSDQIAVHTEATEAAVIEVVEITSEATGTMMMETATQPALPWSTRDLEVEILIAKQII